MPVLFVLVAAFTAAADEIVIPKHSVSGFSAGASMATQHLLSHSSVVEGMGIIGGSPYGCNTLYDAGDTCSGFVSNGSHLENKSIPWHHYVDGIRAGYLAQREKAGRIDALSNIKDKPIYLFSGTDDVWVYQTVMKGVEMQFANLSANIKTEFTLHAAHSWVVDGQTCSAPGVVQGGGGGAHCCGYKNRSTVCPLPPHAATPAPGGCCGQCYSGDGDDRQNRTSYMGWRPPINSCDYDMSGEILRWVLGDANVKPRHTSPLKGGVSVNPAHLFQVNQSQFLQPGWNTTTALLDNWGFLYIPQQCQLQNAAAAAASANGAERSVGKGVAASNASCAASAMFSDSCRIHVHYHPCGGSVRDVSTSYMLQNGLPAYAEANNIVLLYPQSAKYNNPASDACWDWYGATDEAFDTKDGVQIKFVLEMMRQLRGKGEQKGDGW